MDVLVLLIADGMTVLIDGMLDMLMNALLDVFVAGRSLVIILVPTASMTLNKSNGLYDSNCPVALLVLLVVLLSCVAVGLLSCVAAGLLSCVAAGAGARGDGSARNGASDDNNGDEYVDMDFGQFMPNGCPLTLVSTLGGR